MPPYLSLLHNVVGVGVRESSTLQQVEDLRARHHLLVEEELVLLGADDATEEDLVLFNLEV